MKALFPLTAKWTKIYALGEPGYLGALPKLSGVKWQRNKMAWIGGEKSLTILI